MNKPIFCIVGKSGSGKSTYLDALLVEDFIKDNNIVKLKYHTTRTKRKPNEDEYYFVSEDEYNNFKFEIIESREYSKYDELVHYFTTYDDINIESADALICTASIDQAISYSEKLDSVYIINITVPTKERLYRLLNRCNTDNECFEVCRRAVEEETEYSRLYNHKFKDIIGICNYKEDSNKDDIIKENISIILNFIATHISSTYN